MAVQSVSFPERQILAWPSVLSDRSIRSPRLIVPSISPIWLDCREWQLQLSLFRTLFLLSSNVGVVDGSSAAWSQARRRPRCLLCILFISSAPLFARSALSQKARSCSVPSPCFCRSAGVSCWYSTCRPESHPRIRSCPFNPSVTGSTHCRDGAKTNERSERIIGS